MADFIWNYPKNSIDTLSALDGITAASPKDGTKEIVQELLARDIARARAKDKAEREAQGAEVAAQVAADSGSAPIDLEDDRRREAAEMMAWEAAKAQAQRRPTDVLSTEESERDAALTNAIAHQIDPSNNQDHSKAGVEADYPEEPVYSTNGKYNDLEHLAALGIQESPLDELVLRTLKGEFGNGASRKAKLGNRYAAVQAALNALLRKPGSSSTRNQVF